jgi:hypothetical protein
MDTVWRQDGRIRRHAGFISYSFCVLCGGRGLHYFPQKGKRSGEDYFIDYHHNEAFFGLAFLDDSELVNGEALQSRKQC